MRLKNPLAGKNEEEKIRWMKGAFLFLFVGLAPIAALCILTIKTGSIRYGLLILLCALPFVVAHIEPSKPSQKERK